MTVPPTGTVTFLLADVEESVRRWQDRPEAVRGVLARYGEILGGVVERHRGYLIKASPDAIGAAFATAADGLAAAIAGQRALADEPWPEAPSPLRARVALHTGAVDEQDGAYAGPSVNRVARLLAAGHPGQALLSQPTFDLVRDDLPSDASLRDLGEHRLQDLIRPERIYQLGIRGLPDDFPPLRTLDTRPNNLPVQATRMIGRERELAEVRERLLHPDVRLLTLTGPGGIGKTRLALQVAADVVNAFRDGVFFVPLAQVADAAHVASTIGRALGVPETVERPLWESLREHLRDRHLLLLLDNFEHVLEAASLVADLLETAPDVNVLVTSRAVLRVYGEHDYPVPPLALPSADATPPLDRMTQYESVRLFVERAQAVKPDFAVTNENAPAVAEICHRLDGLPLAIELAAARSRLLPPQTMLARLVGARGDAVLHLLTGGARDRPRRQQTLRDAIAWSYDLLEPGEQALFRRLGVFAGGCTIETIEGVGCWALGVGGAESTAQTPITYDPTPDTLDAVASLVDKSLLRQEEVDDEPRFRMLETIREFALDQLAAEGELEAMRRRHAAYFLALVEQAEPELRGPRQRAWLRRLNAEHNNLRAALAWSASLPEEAETYLRLATELAWFWYMGGHFEEGRRWMEDALQHREAVGPALRSYAVTRSGALISLQGDHETAQALLEEGLALARALDDSRAIADALHWLGNLHRTRREYDRAVAELEESLGRFRDLEDAWGIGWSLGNLALVAGARGERERSLALLEEGLAACRRIGDAWGIAWSLGNLAVARRGSGDLETAARLQEEGLGLFRELGDAWGTGWALYNLATIAHGQGDLGRAVALFEESLELRRKLGDRRGIARTLQWLGNARRDLGDLTGATWAYRESASLRQSQEDRASLAGLAEALEGLASVLAEQTVRSEDADPDDGVRAARLLGAAETLRVRISGSPGGSRSTASRPAHPRTIATIVRAIGLDGLEHELSVGRALTPEQALALALPEE